MAGLWWQRLCACGRVRKFTRHHINYAASQSVRSQSEKPGSRQDDAAGWWAERNRSGGANRPHLDHSTSSSNSLPLHRPAVCRKPDQKGRRDCRLGGGDELLRASAKWRFQEKKVGTVEGWNTYRANKEGGVTSRNEGRGRRFLPNVNAV